MTTGVGVAALVVSILICASAGRAQDAPPPVTKEKARQLAAEAMKSYSPGVSLDFMPGQADPGFYDFEALSDNPAGSPVVGHFAVNALTGDVWDMAGHCHHLTSATLKRMQADIRRQSALDKADYRKAHAQKPGCDAD